MNSKSELGYPSTINGIFVPNIVRYDSKGRIDENELRDLIRWLVDKGVTVFHPNVRYRMFNFTST